MGDMLNVKYEGQYREYYCSKCGELLAEVHESGSGVAYTPCQHFTREIISIDCYYKEFEECNPEEIDELRENAILKVFNGSTVYLLIPKQI